jgi:hypothetical protein
MPGSVGHRLDSLKTRRIAGGFSVAELARKATVSDQTIIQLENGGNCDPHISQRILDVLAPGPIALTSNSQANPSEVTAAAAHNLQTGDTGSDADINGTRVVTRTSATKFTVPINAGVSGGTGGTATPTLASAGLARL